MRQNDEMLTSSVESSPHLNCVNAPQSSHISIKRSLEMQLFKNLVR